MKIGIWLALAAGWFLPAFAGTVSGFVTEAESGEPLQYVNVSVAGTRIGGQTNKKGYYVLNLAQPGSYRLEYSLVSHERVSQPFTLNAVGENVSLDARLRKSAVELGKIVVTATVEGDPEGPLIRASTIQRGRQDIQSVVSPVESDVFRAVLTLPGVAPISDFSSGLYVRGGSPDQNLILLDDIDVYNPSHFGGVFSTFNTDAVDNVELIKGGYPAKFGGRLSSVLDVTNRQGNRVRPQGVARLSLISSSATLEGPWKLGKLHGSYMASLRRTYLELVKELYPDLPDYYFYDGHAKLNLDLDSRNKLNLSAYFGRDDLSFDFGSVLDLDWGNRTFTAGWVHLFNPRLFSQFIFAGSEFQSNFQQKNSDGTVLFDRKNGIQDLSAKSVLSWKPDNRHELEGGFELKWNDTWLKLDSSYQLDPSSLPDLEVSSLTSAAFIQDNWQLNELWTLQPGLRAAWYKSLNLRPGHIPEASYVNIEPRVSIKRQLDAGESVYANFGAYHQYLTLMTMEISTPFDVWFPLDGSLEPGRSLHYILGYQRGLSQYFQWEAELYYKTYGNLLQYNTGTDFTWNNETGTLSDTFHVGTGFTYGADLLLRNDFNGLQGFLGYTLSQTQRKIEDVNIDPATGQPMPFYPRYDRSHAVSLIQTYNFSQNTGRQILGSDLKLGLNFSYSSGQPTAVPERIYYDGSNYRLIYSYQDRERLPAYLRLDLSAKFEWVRRWGSIEPYLEFINVTGRKNVSFRSYDIIPEEDGSFRLRQRDGTQFPFLPFLGVNVSW